MLCHGFRHLATVYIPRGTKVDNTQADWCGWSAATSRFVFLLRVIHTQAKADPRRPIPYVCAWAAVRDDHNPGESSVCGIS